VTGVAIALGLLAIVALLGLFALVTEHNENEAARRDGREPPWITRNRERRERQRRSEARTTEQRTAPGDEVEA